MLDIKLLVEADPPALTLIVANAYPGMQLNTAEERQRWSARMWQAQQENQTTKLDGAFQGETLVGGMRLFDFRANTLGQRLDVGSAGLVAVDLLHKKEHVASHSKWIGTPKYFCASALGSAPPATPHRHPLADTQCWPNGPTDRLASLFRV